MAHVLAFIRRFASPLIALLALLAIWSVTIWRAFPAFERASFYVEGGLWWDQVRAHGLWDTLCHSRVDYFTAGNVIVISLADGWQRLMLPLGGAAKMQTIVSCLWVAVIFTHAFTVLRRYHGTLWAAAGVAVMVLFPELGEDAVIWGESSNVGYFSALAVTFVVYDAWQREWSIAGHVIAVLWLCVHGLTSPMAAVLVALFSGVRIAIFVGRSFFGLEAWESLRCLLTRWAMPGLLATAYAGYVMLHPSYTNTYHDLLREAVVEKLVARQWIYPLVLGAFQHLNDGTALVLGLLLFSAIGWLAWVTKHLWKSGAEASMTWSADWLILLAVLIMSTATFFSRQFIVRLWGFGYLSVEPERYYIAQNMLMALLLLLLLKSAASRWAQARAAIWTVVMLGLLHWVLLQSDAHDRFVKSLTLAEKECAWGLSLERAAQQAELAEARSGSWPVAMQPVGWYVHVPVQQLNKARAGIGTCAVVKEPAPASDPNTSARTMKLSDAQATSMNGHVLVCFHIAIDNMLDVPASKRQLIIGNINGWDQGRAVYTWRSHGAQVKQKLDQKPRGEVGIDVCLRWAGGTLEDLRAAMSQGWCAFASQGGKVHAQGWFGGEHPTVGLSILPGSESLSDWKAESSVSWNWKWNAKDLKGWHAMADKSGIHLDESDAAGGFDEQAYLQCHPDVAAAVAAGELKSGEDHYRRFGLREGRARWLPRVTLPVKDGHELVDLAGIRIRCSMGSGTIPHTWLVTVKGMDGSERSFHLLAHAQPRGHQLILAADNLTWALPSSEPAASGNRIKELCLSFELESPNHYFLMDEVVLNSCASNSLGHDR